MASVKVYVTADLYNGEAILGWKADPDVDVEIVYLDPELPDPWDVMSVEEADAGLAAVETLMETIKDLDQPLDDLQVERDYFLDDLEWLRDELVETREALDSGNPNPRHAAYDFDYALPTAAEHVIQLDDLPDDLKEAYDDSFGCYDCDCEA